MQLPDVPGLHDGAPPEFAPACAPRLVTGETRQGILRGRWVPLAAEPKTHSHDKSKVALRDFIKLVSSLNLLCIANLCSEIPQTTLHLVIRLMTME